MRPKKEKEVKRMFGMGRGAGRRFRRFNLFGGLNIFGQNNINKNNNQNFGFGFFGRGRGGFGFTRMMLAQQVGDLDRALFGCGPCGQLLYEEYKRQKNQNNNGNKQ